MTTATVKAAVLLEPQRIEFRELSPPTLGPDDAEIEPLFVGVCGTDLACYAGENTLLEMPVVLGHEFCARVCSCGSQVQTVSPGQIVAVAPLIACGRCRFCVAGQEHLCSERIIFGVAADGALRERLTMPARTLYPVPEDVSLQECALAEPLAVALHAVRRIQVAERRVTVSGAGAIGLLIAQAARALDAASVVMLDVNEKRLDLARRLGFVAMQPTEAIPDNSDCLFIATHAPAAIAAIPDLIDFGGNAVVVGLLGNVPADWMSLLLKEGTITTSRYFTLDDFSTALTMLATRAVDVRPLIQDHVEFDDVADRLGASLIGHAQKVVRLVITMPAANRTL